MRARRFLKAFYTRVRTNCIKHSCFCLPHAAPAFVGEKSMETVYNA